MTDLVRRQGRWTLDGYVVCPGDAIEVRRAPIGDIDLGDRGAWVVGLATTGADGVEFDSPFDLAPGSRAAVRDVARFDELVRSGAEVRWPHHRRSPAPRG